MANTIFYTEVIGSVQAVLNRRKQYYSSENRDSNAHAWLFKKIAWAEAFAINGKRSARIDTPKEGGLGPNGMYKSITSDDTYKHYPKPHIESVNVSAEGDFGSIIKLDLKFTVHTLTDLNAIQPFFDIGGDLRVRWGWNNAGTAAGRNGRFLGKIYNFSYNLNSVGGFDCTTQAMMPGTTIIGGNVDAPKHDEDKKIEDALGNSISPNSIINSYKYAEVELSKNTQLNTEPINGLMLVRYNKNWSESAEPSTSTTAIANRGAPGAFNQGQQTQPVGVTPIPASANTGLAQSQGDFHLYISLQRFVQDINQLARDNSTWFKDNNVSIICDETVTKGLVPYDATKLVSANPIEVLFPGYATYGDNNAFKFGTYDAAMTQGDLSKIMISFKWMQAAFAKIGTEKPKGTKSADSSVAGMLQKIFDLIYKHSGERFKLTMVTNPKSKLGKELLIIDINYIETDKVFVYPITAVTQGSIARSVSLQSKVPNEFQTAAFVAASNGFSSQNGRSIGKVLGRPPGDPAEAAKPDPVTLAEAIKSMDGTGVTPDNVKSLQAALKRERISRPPDSTVGKEIIPFPLDFSVTLDGIEGFIFGNAITCNYLPDVYKKASTELAFTVTKVSHTISNGDWTTTLNTVCRIVSQEK